ncbi:MAG: hypothetical protein IPM45_15115 [Acidimicrobiales bacterium]|nr:hypothetical protein [Acidimicrobiales bacterium]
MTRRTKPQPRVVAALLALAALTPVLAVAVAPAPASASEVPVTGDLVVYGRGWGHGRGMGQYGAYGYAVDDGWSYQQILDHYYGGTTLGTVPVDRQVRVRLTAFDGEALIVASGSGRLTTSADDGLAGGRQPRRALYVERVGPGRFQVYDGPGCAGPWTPRPAVVQATRVDVLPPASNDNPDDMLQLCDGPTTRWYRGSVAILESDGTTRVVNAVPVEQYLRSSVTREVPAGWVDAGGGRGAEAVKAQAVAARSYALGSNRYAYADVCDSGACQSYAGFARSTNGGVRQLNEDPRIDGAIRATAGKVRLRNGVPVATEYSSSTGGYTAGGVFPAVPDAGDDTTANPNRTWTATIDDAVIEARYQRGDLRAVEILARNGLGAEGGRVTRLRLVFGGGAVEVTGADFRAAVGLKSDWFSLEPVAGAGSAGGAAPPAAGPAPPATPSGPGAGAGYVLDGFGGLHAFGGAPAPVPSAYIAGWDVFWRLAVRPDGAGYVLDGFGRLHPFGTARTPAPPRPPGGTTLSSPLARDVVLLAGDPGAGYVLDAFGGLHPFGGAPAASGGPSWPGWDVARRVALNPSGTGGYVLDAFGGLHPFAVGAAARPARPASSAYWPGWDVARDLVLVGEGRGYVFDAFGGVHAIGGAAPVAGGGYRTMTEFTAGAAALADGSALYADRFGGLYRAPASAAAPTPGATWPGFPIARDVALVPGAG